ncbi:MAG TPA: 50S ribosomal protein L18 [Polyangia bacterium]|jgi:large subunit ribosomal protein L18
MSANSKSESRKKRHRAIRKRVEGSPERPRLAVFRSTRHIYAQVIDDLSRKTLLSVSDQLSKEDAAAAAGDAKTKKKERAKKVGAAIAKKCLEKGIDKVVFDRAGYKYHGRVSALADGAREAGLKF